MKRIYTIAFALVALFAFSQNATAQKFGPKIGYNLSTIGVSGDNIVINGETVPAAALGTASNMTYGLFYKAKLVPMILDLQFEVNYDPRGTKLDYLFTYEDIQIPIELSMEYNYLTVPALLKAKLLFLYAEAGPYASFLLSAKDKASLTEGVEIPQSEEEDVKDNLKSTDFGFMLGAGIQLGLGPVYLMGGARYTMGMSEIYTDDYKTAYEMQDISFKHHVWTFYAGIGFGL